MRKHRPRPSREARRRWQKETGLVSGRQWKRYYKTVRRAIAEGLRSGRREATV